MTCKVGIRFRNIKLKHIQVVLLVLFFGANVFGALNHIDAYTTPAGFNMFSITPSSTVKQLDGCEQTQLGSFSGVSFNLVESLTTGYRYDVVHCAMLKGDVKGMQDAQSLGVLTILADASNKMVQQRPTSGVDYVQNKVYAITHPGGSVYAATEPGYYRPGTGYSLLKPIQAFWGWSVNIVYGILILIIIFVAFGIMFRGRLPGAANITLQNAIPNIALAMILVPLSYAISGFFIDLLAIGSNLAHEFLIGPGSPGRAAYESRPKAGEDDDRGYYIDDKEVNWFNISSLNADSSDYSGEAAAVGNDLGSILDNVIFNSISTFLGWFDINPSGDAAAVGENGGAQWFGTILNCIIGLLMIYVGIKIFWHLLKKYLTFLLLPIVSPFLFATIAIPGNGTKNIMTYLKIMGAATLAYIVTYTMFLLVIVFSNESFQASIPNLATNAFIPPMLGITRIIGSLQGTGNDSFMGLLFGIISLGIFFSIPSALKGVDRAMNIQDALPSFLTTPFNEFNESRKATWDFTTKTAPGAISKTARIGGRTATNILYSPWRGGRAYQNLKDRAFGRTPGDVGTWEYRKRQELAVKKADYQRDYEDAQAANDKSGMAVALARMQAVDLAGVRTGTGVGTTYEKDKEPKLEISLSFGSGYGGSDNEAVFNYDRMKALDNAAKASKEHPGVAFIYGSMTIKAVNFKLPAKGTVEYAPPIYSKTRTRGADFGSFPAKKYYIVDSGVFNPTDGEYSGGIDPKPGLGIFANENNFDDAEIFGPFIYTEGGTRKGLMCISLEALFKPAGGLGQGAQPPKNITVDTSGTAYYIPFILKLDTKTVFGNENTTSRIYEGGILTRLGELTTNDRMFKIVENGYASTAPMKIKLRTA